MEEDARTRAQRAIEETLAVAGQADTKLARPSDSFVCRPRAVHAVLPSIDVSRTSEGAAELANFVEIGRGGMGVVYAADQRSLARRVAIKTTASAEVTTTQALLHEARIGGALEHPNILPVHQLARDATGTPLLVMKLISGVSWSTLLAEPSHVAWEPLLAGHGDRLRANVEILGQICRALSFAHDVGVVHRDLKPSNVMIGRFGEVYLLDWGAALRLSERGDEPPGIVGTPGYMPPELARGDPAGVEPRTDVYLLGATLYEVLTGRMPHAAPTVLAALTSALLGEPPPDPTGAPRELVELTRTALAPEPAARIASADAFRLELERFLRRREADLIVLASRDSMRRAAELVMRHGATHAGVLEALVEARFGLASALRARPDDEGIRASLDECVQRLVTREVEVGNTVNARAFLEQLSGPNPELQRRIERVEAERHAADEAARAHTRAREDADASLGSKPLRIVSLLAIMLPLPIGLITAYRSYTEGTGFGELAIADAMIVGVVLAGSWIARRRILATSGTRRGLAIGLAWCVSSAMSDLTTYASGGTIQQASVHSLVAAGSVLALGAVFFDRRLVGLVMVNVVAIAAGLVWPRAATASITMSLVLNLALWVWVVREHAEQSRANREVGTPGA